MSEQVVADPLEFARGYKSLDGKIAVAHLDRVKESLASAAGEVSFKLTGFLNENNEPGLRCQVQATLKLVCQRCLEPMDYALEIDSSLLLSKDAQVLAEEDPDTPDRIPAQRNLSIAELVEEEILLALPMAPYHPEAACKGQTHSELGTLHPFAALARLKTDIER
jgi:uncharacterized protein